MGTEQIVVVQVVGVKCLQIRLTRRVYKMINEERPVVRGEGCTGSRPWR